MLSSSSSIVALDIGTRRIGVAAANAVARLPHPLTTLEHDASIIETIRQILKEENAAVLVVGLPRNLSGDATAQTATTEQFVEQLKVFGLPIFAQDEAVTSVNAEAELQAKGVEYKKGDIDALAATYILEDFLQEHPEIKA